MTNGSPEQPLIIPPVARRYGIAARVLFRWKQELKPSAVPTFVTVQIADASAPFDATLSQEERAP